MKKLLIIIALITIIGQVSAFPFGRTEKKLVVSDLKDAVKALQQAKIRVSKIVLQDGESLSYDTQNFYNSILNSIEEINKNSLEEARRVRHDEKFN